MLKEYCDELEDKFLIFCLMKSVVFIVVKVCFVLVYKLKKLWYK